MGSRRAHGSFDHLVGSGEEGRRDRESERPRGVEIDEKLDFSCLLDRKVRRLGTSENPAGHLMSR